MRHYSYCRIEVVYAPLIAWKNEGIDDCLNDQGGYREEENLSTEEENVGTLRLEGARSDISTP